MTGFKNVKLGLLGVVSAAVPILFILQADNISSQRKEVEKQKIEANQLAANNLKLTELNKFYIAELAKRGVSDSGRSLISFSPKFESHAADNSGISSSIDDLRRSLENANKDSNRKPTIDDTIANLDKILKELN